VPVPVLEIYYILTELSGSSIYNSFSRRRRRASYSLKERHRHHAGADAGGGCDMQAICNGVVWCRALQVAAHLDRSDRRACCGLLGPPGPLRAVTVTTSCSAVYSGITCKAHGPQRDTHTHGEHGPEGGYNIPTPITQHQMKNYKFHPG
jgi:hypothetical protein